MDGLGAVSLKRSSDAATLRPMPAVEVEGTIRSGLEEEAEETGEGDLRDTARRAVAGETARKRSGFLDVRADGMVMALSDALRNARW